MKYLLNGVIVIQGRDFHKVDDLSLIEKDSTAGTLNPLNGSTIAFLISTRSATLDQAKAIVDKLNNLIQP